MKYVQRFIIPSMILILFFGTASCRQALNTQQPIELANATENNVQVSITLHSQNGQPVLSATFTPQESDLHLYSMEIPKSGLDGLGRPTLFELSKNSSMQAAGALIESVPPQTPASPPFELLVYPAGAVTLSMQVVLPEGNTWVDDEVVVTYMACGEQGCRPPVQQKSISIKIPGAGLFQ